MRVQLSKTCVLVYKLLN